MFKQNVYASIQERCCNAFVEHVIACNNSLKELCSSRKFILEKVIVKISTWILSRSIVFSIVETAGKDSWSSVPSTVRVMSCVL